MPGHGSKQLATPVTDDYECKQAFECHRVDYAKNRLLRSRRDGSAINVRQVCDAARVWPRWRIIYLETVDSATSNQA